MPENTEQTTGSLPAPPQRIPLGRKPLRGHKVGQVTADKRDKTCTVTVSFLARHSKYGKFVRHRSRLHVHDPNNESKLGDQVEIVPCRPVSKTKTWRLLRILEKTAGPEHHPIEA